MLLETILASFEQKKFRQNVTVPNLSEIAAMCSSCLPDHRGIDHPQKKCPDSSVYTIPSNINCGGAWYDINYEECKEKCRKNELPNDCHDCVRPKDGCKYAIYEEGSFRSW